jgi:ADP-ribosylglycohydrolase
MANALWLLEDETHSPEKLVEIMLDMVRKYPDRGYGGRFVRWILGGDPQPYNSFGNGSAMRVSPVGYYAKSLDEALELAKISAEVTHNHPEGIKGAVAAALVIFHCMHGKDKDYIKENVLKYYYPSWYSRTYADIKPDYDFSETCQLTVPVAIICFLESKDYADCLKLAISLGGDADTLAAIAGPMAYAYYKEMPEDLIQHAKTKLSDWMLDLNDQFDTFVEGRK